MAVALTAGAWMRLPLGIADMRQHMRGLDVAARSLRQLLAEGLVRACLCLCIGLVKVGDGVGCDSGGREETITSEKSGGRSQLSSVGCRGCLCQRISLAALAVLPLAFAGNYNLRRIIIQ